MLSQEDIQFRKKRWDDTLADVRLFFLSRGYEEFQTPLLVRTPGMEPNLDPFEVSVQVPGREAVRAGLITSPEYSMKKLLGAGYKKIFTITPVFRNGESLGPHNTPEFQLLEWYAEGTYEDLLCETEALLQATLHDATSWKRLTFEEAKVDAFGDPHTDVSRLFVTNYPLEQAALANISADGTYAERFEAFGDGLELCNGFSELTDSVEQRHRLLQEQEERRQLGKTVFSIDEEFLTSLSSIERPVYGNALGLDRLLMLKYRVRDINDIQLFPAKDRL